MWLVLSGLAMAFFLAVCLKALNSLIGEEKAEFTVTKRGFMVFAALLIGCQPALWYSVGSPFAVMELGGAAAAVGSALMYSTSKGRAGSLLSRRSYSIGLALLATLLHERYFVLVVGIGTVALLTLLGFAYRKFVTFGGVRVRGEFACEGSQRGDVETPGLNRFSEIASGRVFSNLLVLWLTAWASLLYLWARSSIPGSRVITSGGEVGINNSFGVWALWRPVFGLLATLTARGDFLFFSVVDSWKWPLNFHPLDFIEISLGVFAVVAVIYLTQDGRSFRVFNLGARASKFNSTRTALSPGASLSLFTALIMSPILPGSLVAERIEPRWWSGPRSGLLIVFLCLLWVSFKTERRSRVLSPRLNSIAGIAFLIIFLVLRSDVDESAVRPKVAVAAAMREITPLNEDLDVTTLCIVSKNIDDANLSWIFGYGGVVHSAFGRERFQLFWNESCPNSETQRAIINVDY
jgi:hypothetical protein